MLTRMGYKNRIEFEQALSENDYTIELIQANNNRIDGIKIRYLVPANSVIPLGAKVFVKLETTPVGTRSLISKMLRSFSRIEDKNNIPADKVFEERFATLSFE